MTAAARRLLDDALALPDADRAEVAGALAESVGDELKASGSGSFGSPDADAPSGEHRAAWSAELRRRAEEIDSGAVELIPADDVLLRLRTRKGAGAG